MPYTRSRRQAKPAVQVQEITTWYIWTDPNGIEDRRIFQAKHLPGKTPYLLDMTNIREFDSTVDDRGPCVRFIATWGNEEKDWYPESSGSWVYKIARREDRPVELQGWELGFGSVSSPQTTKAAIHREYLTLIEREPRLAPYIKFGKVPCVFSKDHPEVPGGAFVEIPLESLPPACDKSKLSRIYQ